MATTVAKLEARLDADTGPFDRAMRHSDSTFSKIGRNIGRVALAAGAAIGVGLGIVAKVGFDELAEGQKSMAETAAHIKSTGGAANVTAKHVQRLASSLSRLSGVDDDLIQSGANMLLTFTSIRNEVGKGNDIFDQANKVLLDLSATTGIDMRKSAIQLGKALNDPIRGITALRRVGVQFTESQEKQIKKMVEAGDVMGAQKLILKELNTEFGGTAAAVGQTLPGQLNILKNAFRDMAAGLVTAVLPALMSLVTWTTKHMPQIEAVIRTAFGGIRLAAGIIGEAVGFIRDLLFASGTHFDKYGNAVTHTVFRFRHELNVMKDVAVTIFNAVKGYIVGTLLPAFQTMRARVTDIVRDIAAVLKKHKPEFLEIWQSVKSIVTTVVKLFNEQVLPALKKSLPRAIDIAIPIIRDLAKAFAAVANAVYTIISAITTFEKKIGINGGLLGSTGGLPNIPGLKSGLLEGLGIRGATGGIVTRPTMALIGESGPEAVVPLNRSPGSRPLGAGALGGTVVFNFPNYVGSHSELETAMQRVMARYEQRNNRRFGSR